MVVILFQNDENMVIPPDTPNPKEAETAVEKILDSEDSQSLDTVPFNDQSESEGNVPDRQYV